jgi:hypothetical protein
LEEDGEASQEMDVVVQGEMAADDWEMVRGAVEEGIEGAPDRLALKKRRIAMKIVVPRTLEARAKIKVKI